MSTQAGSMGSSYQNPYTRQIFGRLPAGLWLDPDMVKEFKDPPTSPNEWFIRDAWDNLSSALIIDDAVSQAEWQALSDGVTSIHTNLMLWTQLRDPATAGQGWGPQSRGMRIAGSSAFLGIRDAAADGEALTSKVSDKTKQALFDFCTVLWEYAECLGLELEATTTQQPLDTLVEQANDALKEPWKPSMTPTNVRSTYSIGSHRDAAAPDPTDAEFWDRDDDPADDADPGSATWAEPAEGGGGEGGGV